MIKYLLLLSITFSTFISNSQSFDYTKHLEQYWNYRYALLGDNIDPDYY